MKKYNFTGIPHFLLIDKQGNFINSDLSEPEEAEKYILGRLNDESGFATHLIILAFQNAC